MEKKYFQTDAEARQSAVAVTVNRIEMTSIGTSNAMGLLRKPGKRHRSSDFILSDLPLPEMASTTPEQYRACPLRRKSRAIVLDCGSHMLRAGFSSAPDCVQIYPPLVARVRDPNRPNIRNDVGWNALSPALRSTAKPAFDAGIPSNGAIVERLFDGALVSLGLADEESIEHRFVISEPPCVPNTARAAFTELLFEGYDASAVTYGIDALFAYAYNIRNRSNCGGLGFGRNNSIVVSCGHAATHVLPIVGGKFQACSAKRINVGGAHMTNHFARRLHFLHHDLAPVLSMSRVEQLKHQLCTVATNFEAQLNSIMKDTSAYEESLRIVKVPHLYTSEKPQATEEEIERTRQARIESGRRLSEMMKEKRRAKAAQNAAASSDGIDRDEPSPEPIKFTEAEVQPLYKLLAERYELQRFSQIHEMDEDDYFAFLVNNEIKNHEAFTQKLDQLEEALHAIRKSVGEAKADAAEKQWWKRTFEDELLSVPDNDLPATKLKTKRHTKALRGAAESRLRVKREKAAKRAEEFAKKEAIRKRREEDPQGYLQDLIAERLVLAEKKKRRRAARQAGSDRRSLANRNRMRLIAEHAGRMGDDDENLNNSRGRSGRGRRNRGRGGRNNTPGVSKGSGVTKKVKSKAMKNKKHEDDDFGMRDSDWDVYRDMQVRKDGAESDTGSAADDERLTEVRKLITEMAPDLDDPTIEKREGSALLYEPHPYPDEIPVVVDRYRVPELLFQPSLVGVEQMGLIEAITTSVRSFPESDRRSIVKEVFLSGGVGSMAGLECRLKHDLKSVFPIEWGQDIENGVWKSKDPVLDAWRGAALFAEQGGEEFEEACVFRADYEEKGPDYLGESSFSNWWVEKPDVVVIDKKRVLRS